MLVESNLFMTDIDHILSREAIQDALAFEGQKMNLSPADRPFGRDRNNPPRSRGSFRPGVTTGPASTQVCMAIRGSCRAPCSSSWEGTTRPPARAAITPSRARATIAISMPKWNRAFRGETPYLSPNPIYLFPCWSLPVYGDLNPHGLFTSFIKEKKWRSSHEPRERTSRGRSSQPR